MTTRREVDEALARAHRDDWAVVVGATVRAFRDLDLAETCVQEAYVDALHAWPTIGVPDNPAAWLTTAARRRAIDVIRREKSFRSKLPLLIETEPIASDPSPDDETAVDPEVPVRDEALRLILLCCHPALAREACVALTLRLVSGIETPDVARAFLVSESTMAARLTRAKRKITGSGIPFRLPAVSELPGRLGSVFDVVHLVFTTGYTAPSGGQLVRLDLVDEAIRVARLLLRLLPADPEVQGLLALFLATDARRSSRVSADGLLVGLEDQDRSRWDRDMTAEARRLTMTALPASGAGRYALQTAIAVLYAEAPTFDETDWLQIFGLYDRLVEVWPNPVVALNRTVPLSYVEGPAAALREVEALARDGRLDAYPYLPAVTGDFLARLDRPGEAVEAYRSALALTANVGEEEFLRRAIERLESS